jgi:hypothetical protein
MWPHAPCTERLSYYYPDPSLCTTILRGLTEELLGGRRTHGEDGGGEEMTLGGEDVSMRALDLANEAVSS